MESRPDHGLTWHIKENQLAALTILLLAGCDPGTGVIPTVTFTNSLSNEKIEAALRDVVGETGIEHRTNGYDVYWITRTGAVVAVIEEANKGRKTLRLQNLRIGPSSTLAEHADTRKQMDEIYASLRKQTPDLPEPKAVREASTLFSSLLKTPIRITRFVRYDAGA